MARRNRRRKKSSRRQSPIASLLIVVAVVVVCLAAVTRTMALKKESRALAENEYILEQRLEEVKQESVRLDAETSYMQTNQYIEDVAKDKLGLVYPDEIVIKPNE